ncbi:hypothetical protein E2R56_16745 [Rhodococcus qingshengii]|nr:hypothetical protein E2R56_16745 [Rhodococcus qingshengii]
MSDSQKRWDEMMAKIEKEYAEEYGLNTDKTMAELLNDFQYLFNGIKDKEETAQEEYFFQDEIFGNREKNFYLAYIMCSLLDKTPSEIEKETGVTLLELEKYIRENNLKL